MAKLPQQTLTTIFTLQQRLVELIDEAKFAEYSLFERYGETGETMPEFEQLQNGIERLRIPYSRLYTLALGIAEAQPVASSAMLELLDRTIEQAQLIADDIKASTQETKSIWNLS